MSGSPNLDELKDLCGSDKLHKCFKFIFSQEIPLNEVMIQCLGEKRDELRISVDKRTKRMAEVLDLNFDEEEAAADGYESLEEVQVMERRLLESLSAILVDLRALVSKKEEAIADMDYYDQSSS
jgi:hypothetical protein